MSNVSRRLVAIAAAAALIVTACGDDNAGDSASATRELEDVLGTVEVPERPERIIADSVSTLAHLWALGVVPIGAALPGGISTEYIDPAAGDVPNLVSEDGWTLNVEEILAAKPDLVVAIGADYNIENCERYKAATTTYCFTEQYDDEQQIKDMFTEVAIAVGRQDEAAAAIAAYDAKKADLAERIAATDLPNQMIGVVRFDSGGFIGIRTEPALAALGLHEPEWPPVGPSGYVELSLETLDVLNAADHLFITLDDDVDPAKVDAFQSPLWDLLEPVAAGQAYVVSAWNGADIPQLNRILDDIERALVVPAEAR